MVEVDIDPKVFEANIVSWKLYKMIEIITECGGLHDFFDYKVSFYTPLLYIAHDKAQKLNELVGLIPSVKKYTEFTKKVVPATMKEFIEADHKQIIAIIKTASEPDAEKLVLQIPILHKRSVLNYAVRAAKELRPAIFFIVIRTFDVLISHIRFDIESTEMEHAAQRIVTELGEQEIAQLPIRLAKFTP